MRLAWEKISDRVIKINRFRSLRKKRFRLPNGAVGDFYTINRPNIVCALVITPDNKVVIAKQFRPGVERVMFELPGGRIDRRETPRQAVIREVLEETGYRGHSRSLGRTSNDGWSDGWRHHFLFTNAKAAQKPKNDEYEAIEVVTVSMKTFFTMLAEGKMTDGETAYRGLMALGVLEVRR
ncbi:MAG: NUDIX hydrolase [Patescibacteria group bacterium]